MEIFVLFIFLLIVFFIIIKEKQYKIKKNNHKKNGIKYKKIKGGGRNINLIHDKFVNNKIITDIKDIRIKPFILNIKFHNHYRDILTAIDNMLPVPKNVFNKVNIRIEYSIPKLDEIELLISDFIITLNNHIKRLPDFRNNNSGWDEALPDPMIKSGWDKFTDKIGIPNSLYELPAKNGLLFLIDTFNNEKQETDDELRYIITLILGKELVEDQLLLRISVAIDKRCLSESKQKVVLEEIEVLGYLSDYGDSNVPENTREPFYAFNQMTKNDVISNHEILLELERNFLRRSNIVQNMMGITDIDSRIFGKDLPDKSSLESHKVTRTIEDDMTNKYF